MIRKMKRAGVVFVLLAVMFCSMGASWLDRESIPVDQKGMANGVATLDGTGKVPMSQIPAGATNNVEGGTVNGQLVYWDNIAGEWKHTEITELFWDDINKRFGITGDFSVSSSVLFIDVSNGSVNLGSAVTGTDRFNVFGPTTGVQTGIASFYDSSSNIKFRIRDQWTASSIPPRIESESSLGFAMNTTNDAPFLWYVNGTSNEKMRLTTTGLGIGVDNPTNKLHVEGTDETAASILVKSTDVDSDSYFVTRNDAIPWSLGVAGDNSDAFTISRAVGLSQPKLIINSAGDVGVGGTPTEKLDVVGNAKVSGTLNVGGGSLASWQAVIRDNSAFPLKLEGGTAGGSVVMGFYSDVQGWRVGFDANEDFTIRDETAGKTSFIIRNDAPASSFVINADGTITVFSTVDGRDLAVDGTKLDGVEASATGDQTNAEIKIAYEANADTNEFSDAEQTKLSGIATGAEVATKEIFIPAGAAVLASNTSFQTDHVTFPDAVTVAQAWFTMYLPSDFSNMASGYPKVVFAQGAAGTGDYRIAFTAMATAIGEQIPGSTDSIAEFTRAAPGLSAEIWEEDVSASFNNLGLTANDHINIRIDRDSDDVLDTFSNDLDVLGVVIKYN